MSLFILQTVHKFVETVEDALNMDLEKRLVHQRRRVFAPERNKAIRDEVNKLLAAKFI